MIVRTAAAALLLAGLAACSGTPAPTPGPAPSAAEPTTTAPAAAAEIPAVGVPAAAAASTETPAPTAATVEPAPASASDRPAIEKVLEEYDAAVLARDFATACSLLVPEAGPALVDAVNAGGGMVTTCEQAYAAAYAGAYAARQLDEAARSLTISDVTVAGDTASVTFSSEIDGQKLDGLTHKMRRADGRWQILGNDA